MLTELINPTETWTVVYTVKDGAVSFSVWLYFLWRCFVSIPFDFSEI